MAVTSAESPSSNSHCGGEKSKFFTKFSPKLVALEFSFPSTLFLQSLQTLALKFSVSPSLKAQERAT